MRTTSADNFVGADLGKKVSIEIVNPDGGTQYTRGILVEWTGVANPEPGEDGSVLRMYRAVLATGDNARGSVMLHPEATFWIHDNEDEPFPGLNAEEN